MSSKRALVTGINGQDGSYLAELLLEEGYEVHGLVRRASLEAPQQHLGRLVSLLDRVQLHPASLESYAGIFHAIAKIRPQECYHLAAASYVSYEFDDEFSTLTTNINGTHYLLAALKDLAPACRFYFAGTSEMFGSADSAPQNEYTRFRPRSVYGISKLAGFELVRNYRERYGTFACSGILFNHESPRRGHEYVTRKITSAVARILAGHSGELRLGNLDAVRDWGYAREYVRAMWLMLQQERPDDFVIATGCLHSVREFVRIAFEHAGLDWREFTVVDPNFYRDAETIPLCGDASKARHLLGWEPECRFEQLVHFMVEEDCRRLGVSVPALGQSLPD
jgi:GDPmannose 4,6-dehydratase